MIKKQEHSNLRARVYWWLERPERGADGPRILEIALIVLITLNVAAVILETVDSIYARWQTEFDVFEVFLSWNTRRDFGSPRKTRTIVPV